MTATTAGRRTPRPAPRRRTLPFRVELARQLSQRRTRFALGVLVLVPVLVRVALLVGGAAPSSAAPSSAGTDLVALAQASGGTFAAFVLLLAGGFLVTIVTTLLFGDLIAGEASRSTLKYLLTIPVTRQRLLAVKVAVATVLLVAGVAGLTAVALVVGVLSYGPGGLQVPGGPRLALGETLLRLAGAALVVPIGVAWAAALATLLSVATDSPLGAAGGAVVVLIVSRILDQVPTLGPLRLGLPTHFGSAYQRLLTSPVDLAPIADALLVNLIFATVLGTAAVWWFGRKDVSG